MEVDEQSKSVIALFEIAEKLRKMDIVNFAYRFGFNHEFLFNEHIHSESAIELNAFVGDWDCNFFFDLKTKFGELIEQAFLIDFFQQSGPEFFMDVDCCAAD